MPARAWMVACGDEGEQGSRTTDVDPHAASHRVARKSPLTNQTLRAYPERVTNISRNFYFYGFFYYGYPLAGRDWRRTRE